MITIKINRPNSIMKKVYQIAILFVKEDATIHEIRNILKDHRQDWEQFEITTEFDHLSIPEYDGTFYEFIQENNLLNSIIFMDDVIESAIYICQAVNESDTVTFHFELKKDYYPTINLRNQKVQRIQSAIKELNKLSDIIDENAMTLVKESICQKTKPISHQLEEAFETWSSTIPDDLDLLKYFKDYINYQMRLKIEMRTDLDAW